MVIDGERPAQLAALHAALCVPGAPADPVLLGLGCALHKRGETPDDIAGFQHLLDEIPAADLCVALTCGVGWDAMAEHVTTGQDLVTPQLDPSAQRALTVLAQHGGEVPQRVMRNSLGPAVDLGSVRRQLEQASLLRVIPPEGGSAARWIVPLAAAGAVVGSCIVEPARLAPRTDSWGHVLIAEYRQLRRAVLRRLEAAQRHDETAAELVRAITPAAIAFGDAWLVHRLTRRHLGMPGRLGRSLRACAARLAWSSGQPEVARATLGPQRDDAQDVGTLDAGVRIDGIHLELAEALVSDHGSDHARTQALLDLGRRAADSGDGPVVAPVMIDGAVHAAMTGDLEAAKRLVEESQWLALGAEENYLTGRSCLAQALTCAIEGTTERAARYCRAGLSMLTPAGEEVVVGALAETMSPALLTTTEDRVRATHLAVGFASAHCEGTPGWSVLATQPALPGAFELVRLGAASDDAMLLTAAAPHRPETAPAATVLIEPVDQPDLLVVPTAPMPTAPVSAASVPPESPSAEPVPVAACRERPSSLTHRESQVAELVARGMTNDQVARNLGISRWTVVNHLRNVMRKLECVTRVEVAAHVLRAPTAGLPGVARGVEVMA